VQTALVKAIGISSAYFIERHATYSNKVKAKAAPVPKRNADLIEPMEYALVSKLPGGADWTFEVKFDGYWSIRVKMNRCSAGKNASKSSRVSPE
jgi:ATP-dependent DNA ligase